MKKFSEYNEEPFLLNYFKHKHDGFFVDIGANNGWKGSNTRALFLRGWSGLLVEADPKTFESLKRTYANEPRVRLLHCAVWDKEDDVDFYSHLDEDSGLSSVNPYYQRSKTCRTVRVPCHTLDKAIEIADIEDVEIDFLSVDAEGCDFDIVRCYTFKRRPKLFMVEYGAVPETERTHGKQPLTAFDEAFDANGYSRIWTSPGNAAYFLKEP